MKRTTALIAAALATVLLAVSAVPVFAQEGASSSDALSAEDIWADTAVTILNSSLEANATSNASAGANVPAGIAVLQMTDNNSNEICYWLFVSDISNVTQAHIHQGKPGEEGPVVAALYPAAAQSGNATSNATSNQSATQLKSGIFTGMLANGTIAKTDLVGPLQGKNISDLVNLTRSGNAYVNVHTTQNPAGEIRGDLNSGSWWTDSNFVFMNSAQEVGANQTSGGAGGNTTLSNQSAGNVTSPNITAGVTTSGSSSAAMGVAVFQKVNQSGTTNQSSGNATGNASSNQTANFRVHYAIWVINIENVTQAHIHIAPRGQEGPVVVPLFPASSQGGNATGNATSNATSSNQSSALKAGRFEGKLVEGNFTSSDFVGPLQGNTMDDLQTDMLNGSAYVNVHTTLKPAGEIRGQFDLQNTSCYAVTESSEAASGSASSGPNSTSPSAAPSSNNSTSPTSY